RGVAQLGLERLVRDQEVGGSNPLAPIFLRNEPFGEHVEGPCRLGRPGPSSIPACPFNFLASTALVSLLDSARSTTPPGSPEAQNPRPGRGICLGPEPSTKTRTPAARE